MPEPATLHIQDTPELKIARNFLILGLLINALVLLFFSLPILSLILSIISFAFSTGGFYKLSKLARSQILFKYYTFLVLDGVLMGIIAGIINTNETLKTGFSIGAFVVLICAVFYFYFFYRICLELTKITTIDFFTLAFKGMIVGIVVFLIGCLFLSMGEVFYFISIASLIIISISGILFVIGIFKIKKIVYYEG
ncbi:hypothetical protein BKH42_00425 [Helicobacter sp. 13S00482-2]|uniref:hypothetical protein n=1 Tax=Helicobacter sp. 13S00482-2 TaxID=1476200 RepID=UPI000BA59044|nr:hypothetical protein [Helicobacter sp. 13S00482-2]PAF54416.1 hypothetical protein BKH42_00425 [Helicobacter sp. 13S00482-2]